jgi:hypothetical protein
MALRRLAEAHYRESVEERDPSLYEIKVSWGADVIVYHRLALPFVDSDVARFLLLGISVEAAQIRGLRALMAAR